MSVHLGSSASAAAAAEAAAAAAVRDTNASYRFAAQLERLPGTTTGYFI